MIHFDLECDALLDKVTKVHCMWLYDTDTKEFEGYHGSTIKDGVKRLSDATNRGVFIDAFNGFGYDYQALLKLYPRVFVPDTRFLTDSMLKCRLVFSDVYTQLDEQQIRKGKFPASLGGSHSLKAWGMRLGEFKDDYQGGFDSFNEEMYRYCKQDVAVLVKIHEYLSAHSWADENLQPMQLELRIRKILTNQENTGVCFDVPKALALTDIIRQKAQSLSESLKAEFGSFYVRGAEFTPAKDNARLGYMAKAPLTKLDLIEFNPGSRQHIINRFQHKYNHKFTELTEKENIKIDDDILAKLPYPEAQQLAEYMLLNKRLAALSTGNAAWLSLVNPATMRIHGRVTTQGTPTGRATHSSPNLAQVPAVRSTYGKECRELFRAPEGKILIGADLSGLELRCLGHYLYPYDNGEYINELLKGDIHTKVQKLCDLPTRDSAKTLSYALIYGAGDGKLGKLVNGGKQDGEEIRARYMKGITGFDRLLNDVKKVVRLRGAIKAPDGRLMPIRSEHSALNTLLQGCGAIISKQAIVEVNLLIRDTLKIANKAQQILWVHDEIIFESYEDYAESIGKACIEGFEKAGKVLSINCPITGEYKIGQTWADVH